MAKVRRIEQRAPGSRRVGAATLAGRSRPAPRHLRDTPPAADLCRHHPGSRRWLGQRSGSRPRASPSGVLHLAAPQWSERSHALDRHRSAQIPALLVKPSSSAHQWAAPW